MEYEDNIRKILLRFPHRGSEVKIFINQKISGCDEDFLNGFDSPYVSVDNPDDADYIPIWIDYKSRCSPEILQWIEKYPNKCVNVVHFIDAVNAEQDEITDEELENIKEMLSSPDWKSIQLGLSLLRAYVRDSRITNLIKAIIDTVSTNPMSNTATIKPLGSDQDITIENLELVAFFHIWLHNEYLKI